jgi:ABC-type transport system involved in multi-copper enzyme maturation permease subunit
MLLFSVGFGSLSFKFLEPVEARKFIRKTFPYFYGFVLGISALLVILSFNVSKTIAALGLIIFLTAVPTSQILMPAINKASDLKRRRKFITLHALSVVIPLMHIIICAVLLYLISKK